MKKAEHLCRISLRMNRIVMIKILLKYGAGVDIVYRNYSYLLGKLAPERPPENPLSIILTGDGGVGKSTLLKAMLSSKGFRANFMTAKPVTGVDERTVGIIPYETFTKEFGRVIIIIYDFAGPQEFYPSHCAVLENALQSSPRLSYTLPTYKLVSRRSLIPQPGG